MLWYTVGFRHITLSEDWGKVTSRFGSRLSMLVEARLEASATVQKELVVVADRPASKVRTIIHDMLRQE